MHFCWLCQMFLLLVLQGHVGITGFN